MALDPAVGFPSGAEMTRLFDVLNEHAFTREIDDQQDAPRDGLGLPEDWITVLIDEAGVEVKATTRELRIDREQAYRDAEALFESIVQAGSWTAHRGGQISLHSARQYQPEGPTEEVAGWFGAVVAYLVLVGGTKSAERQDGDWPLGIPAAG